MSQVKNTENHAHCSKKMKSTYFYYLRVQDTCTQIFLNGCLIKTMYICIFSLKYFLFLREPLKYVKIHSEV